MTTHHKRTREKLKSSLETQKNSSLTRRKKKLEEKCGQRLITKSAVLEALCTHDEDFAGADEQIGCARTLARNFKEAIDIDEQE